MKRVSGMSGRTTSALRANIAAKIKAAVKATDFKRLGTVIVLALTIAAQMTMQAQAALPAGQQRVFDDGIGYFNVEPDVAVGCGGGGSESGNGAALVGSDNVHKAMNYFTSTRGLTADQAAGIVSNLMRESSPNLSPDIIQGKPPTHGPAPLPGKGYGIGQWTDAGRQAGLIKMAQQDNKPASDLGVQLDYIWQELNTTYRKALDDLKSGLVRAPGKSAAYNAAVSVLINYEGARNQDILSGNGLISGNYADKLVGGAPLPGGGTSTPTTTGVTGCTTGSIACNTNTTATTVAQINPVRQQAVCLARQELAAWQAPGVQPAVLCSKYGAGKPCEEWCADFVSWVFDQAKYPLKPDPNWRVPSVQGVWDIGKNNLNFHFHSSGGYTPKPGDIAIHKIGGSHTNIVVDVTGTTVTMIGGDQGPGPYGGPNSRSIVSQVSQQGASGGGTNGYVTID